ncbi:MAG: CoA ester lyase [Alphaproteobacteria bacterium]|jgi:citrate lyase subunit beta/citryl-CoA lyase|nr:CoA ester lyase [Alphaproteobacteria bacterium]
MSLSARPRRSILYMPGSNERALEKAKTIPADGVILDLEDATAPDKKNMARDNVCKAVETGGYGKRELIIRTNALNTEWGYADVVAASKTKADALLIPKVESADTVRQIENIMVLNGAHDQMAIWCMMETPRGILHAEEIAGATRRMTCMVMGTSDLAKELDCAHTRERLPMITSLGLCLLVSRAYNIYIIDGVYLDLQDEDGFAYACRQGAELGFDGKTLIHPKQVEPANRAFSPTPSDVEWSRKIIAAHEEAAREGKGVVLVDGKLVENLHVESARRMVAMADRIADLEAAQ